MTDQTHPITPPPELIAKWASSMCGHYEAARWGADQELQACCEWLDYHYPSVNCGALRAARRPKPPSLKEQALAKLAAMERLWEAAGNEPSDIVRRALEQLGPSLSTTDD